MASHIYWRILFTKAPGGFDGTAISRLEMHPIVSGINLCIVGNGQIFASSESPPIKNNTFVAYNAVDNNKRSDWMTVIPSANEEWIKYEFVSPQQVEEIQFTASNITDYVNYAPQDFKVQWSNDDINWTTSFVVTGEINWGKGEARLFSSEDIRSTIARGFTSVDALPISVFTDHLLAKEAETASPVAVHRNKAVSLGIAESRETGSVLGIHATQHISIGQAVERSVPLDMTVKVTIVLLEPTTQTTSAHPFTFKKTYCPIHDFSSAYPVSYYFTKKTDEFGHAYPIKVNKRVRFPIGPIDYYDGATSFDHALSRQISIASESDTGRIVHRGVIYMDLGQAASVNQSLQLTPEKTPPFNQASETDTSSALTIARGKTLQTAEDKSGVIGVSVVRYGDVLTAEEKESSSQFTIHRTTKISLAEDRSAGTPFTIKRNTSVLSAGESDFALEVRPSRGFDFLQPESKSSASALGYSRGAQLQIAEERSTGIPVALLQDKFIDLGISEEKDIAQRLFRCPIYEADSAYSIERGHPNIIQITVETDTSSGSRPVKNIPIAQVEEKDSPHGVPFTIVAQLGQAYSTQHMLWVPSNITPVRSVPISRADALSSVGAINEDKSQTIGPVGTKSLALRVFPPFSGTLGIAGEKDDPFVSTPNKNQTLSQAPENDTAVTFNPVHSKELGIALEDDIARLASHFNTVRLGLIDAQSGGLPVDPLRTVHLGQSVSSETGGPLNRDRDIPVNPADTTSSANPLLIHIADQFNQAVESEVALYVTAVKTKALQLATEHDSIHAFDKILKAKGINIGTEEDTANALNAAFAFDFDQATEGDSAIGMSLLRTIILGLAGDGAFSYALDRVLKEQGLQQVVENDVANIPTANLTKEIKSALEYNEAQRIDAARVNFLLTAATDDVAHALGQTMKRQLIGIAASSSDAPFLVGEQPWRNKWQASVSIQQDIEFSLSVQQDFEGVVSLQQDAEFVVAIQDNKQFVEEI